MLVDRGLNGSAIAGFGKLTDQQGWEAELRLGFAIKNGKTVLSHRHHRGPLTVQRPFYPGDGVCHVYLLHPPGGVVAGDRLDIGIAIGKDGRALMTTPAAGKFYRSSGKVARQSVLLQIDKDASMEWLPQEAIVYEGAHLTSSMDIHLDAEARFIGWEIQVLGRPASKEAFHAGAAFMNWSITLAGRPIYIERMQLEAEAFSARWGLNGCSACATMAAYPASMQALEIARALTANNENLGVTRIGDLLICRGVDSKADRLRLNLQCIWAAIRQEIIGCQAEPPRIWAT